MNLDFQDPTPDHLRVPPDRDVHRPPLPLHNRVTPQSLCRRLSHLPAALPGQAGGGDAGPRALDGGGGEGGGGGDGGSVRERGQWAGEWGFHGEWQLGYHVKTLRIA